MAEQPIPDPIEEEEEGQEPTAEEKGGLGKLLLLVFLPLVLLSSGGGAWVAYSHYPSFTHVLATMGIEFGTDDATEEEQPIEYGEFMQFDNLIVNPAYTDGTRYLMIGLGLESSKAAVFEEVEVRKIVIQDAILRLLSQRSVEELTDINLRDVIKQELRVAINEKLEKGEIDRLYFTQYVLQ